jgi:hypothetical protein
MAPSGSKDHRSTSIKRVARGSDALSSSGTGKINRDARRQAGVCDKVSNFYAVASAPGGREETEQ